MWYAERPVLPLQVPGGYQDSLSSNTELGRAVQNACDELDNLSNLVQDLAKCAAWLCTAPCMVSLCVYVIKVTRLGAAGEGVIDKSQ